MALTKCKDCGKDLSTSAPKCPHCGAPIRGATSFAGCAGIAVLVVAGLAVIGSMLPKSEASKKRDVAIEACISAQDFVKRRLKAPSTADFQSCAETNVASTRNPDEYVVAGYVDAQNGFGAKIRSNWIVTQTRLSEFHWTASDVQILGD